MSHALVVMQTPIRQDHEGRYCLNDLHRAAGGEKRHQPSNWVNLIGTHALVQAIEKANTKEGRQQSESIVSTKGLGTFVAKELAYDFAGWISKDFYLKLVRTYEELQTERLRAVEGNALPDFSDPVAAARAWANQTERMQAISKLAVAQQRHIEEVAPAVEFHAAVARAENTLSIAQFARIMGIGERKLFELLRVNGVLITGGPRHNLPYQMQLNYNRFKVVERTHTDSVTGSVHVRGQTRITPKGQMWIQQTFFPKNADFIARAHAQLQYSLRFGDDAIMPHSETAQLSGPQRLEIEDATRQLAASKKARSAMLVDPEAVPAIRMRQYIERTSAKPNNQHAEPALPEPTDPSLFLEEQFSEAGRTYFTASAYIARQRQ